MLTNGDIRQDPTMMCVRCRKIATERNKVTAEKLRRVGRPVNGKCLPGFKIVGHKRRKRYALRDPNETNSPARIGTLVIRLREDGMAWEQVYDFVEEFCAREEGRKPHPRNKKRRWGIGRLRRAYELAIKVRDGVPLNVMESAANGEDSAQ